MRHLLLDFGGVCLLSPVELHRHVERALGLKEGTFDWYGPIDPSTDALWRAMIAGELTEREYWHRRAAEVGRAAGRADFTLRDYMHVCFALPEATIIRDQAYTIVADVHRAGGRVGVLTNDLNAFHGEDWVASIAFFRDIDSLTDASLTRILKPDPRAFAMALVDLGVERHETLFIDDQPKNALGATEFGLATVLFDVADPERSWREARGLLGL